MVGRRIVSGTLPRPRYQAKIRAIIQHETEKKSIPEEFEHQSLVKHLRKNKISRGVLISGGDFPDGSRERKLNNFKSEGYAQGIPQARGSRRDARPKVDKSLDEILNDSAKLPKSDNVKVNTPVQQFNAAMAQGRRAFLKKGLVSAETRNQNLISRLAEKNAEAENRRKRRLEMMNRNTSESITLALPTIERYIKRGIIEKPSQEERIRKSLARKANREEKIAKDTQLREQSILSLYQAANKFITNEQELDQEIENIFGESSILRQTRSSLNVRQLVKQAQGNNDSFSIFEDSLNAATAAGAGGVYWSGNRLQNLQYVTQALAGVTSSGQPGLDETNDALKSQFDRLRSEWQTGLDHLPKESEKK